MKKLMAVFIAVAALLLTGSNIKAQDSDWSGFFVVTSSTSPENATSLQNAMLYIANGRQVGHISANTAVDPAALNTPHTWRAVDLVYGFTGMWDATNSTGSSFAAESGKRIAWGYDRKRAIPFLVSDVWFALSSSDAGHALAYSGNLATNTATGQANTFSSTLWGEYWNADGTTNVYSNGETIFDHPVNRVIGFPREGWSCANITNVNSDLTYFRDVMTFSSTAAFWVQNGGGVTNWVGTKGYLTANPVNASGMQVVTLEGQRQLGISYYLQGSPSVLGPWTTLGSIADGGGYTNVAPVMFYRSGEVFPPTRKQVGASQMLQLVGSNGPE